jgi:anti-sigma factor RsiW
VNKQPHNQHPSAERLQALLDGLLPPEGRRLVEEHVLGCARCAAEMSAWRALFEELEDLPVLAPSIGFAERVLEGVGRQESPSLAARVRSALAALVPRRSGHPGDDRLQDFVEGLLSPKRAARVSAHLEACGGCSAEAEEWRFVVARLDNVGHLAPTEGFADRVMARVHVRAVAPAARSVPEWRRALDLVGRLIPQTRQAWAALSGVAVTPVATLGLLLWTLVTHPTLTPGALASFAWWKVAELASTAWQSLASAAVESTGLFEVYSFLGSLVASPALLVTAFAMLSVGTLSAVWILYRNLVATQPTDGRYAHASLS